MRKRVKKRIAVVLDEDGYYLNCYGNRIPWRKDEIKRARRKAKKWAKVLNGIWE